VTQNVEPGLRGGHSSRSDVVIYTRGYELEQANNSKYFNINISTGSVQEDV